MKIEKRYLDLIINSAEKGDSKNDIAEQLFKDGLAFNQIPAAFKESGVKFRRSGTSTWKMICAELFKENPETTADEMAEAIEDSVKDPEYYVKAYYDMFKYIVS